jgi:hypothetical protein
MLGLLDAQIEPKRLGAARAAAKAQIRQLASELFRPYGSGHANSLSAAIRDAGSLVIALPWVAF